MTIRFDRALGIHADALAFRSRRAEVLANNLANADTPNFKARDLDFASVLAAREQPGVSVRRTHQAHLDGGTGAAESALRYRLTTQPSIDCITLDSMHDYVLFSRNVLV